MKVTARSPYVCNRVLWSVGVLQKYSRNFMIRSPFTNHEGRMKTCHISMYEIFMEYDQMRSITFQQNPLYGPHSSSIGVTRIECHWFKRFHLVTRRISSRADMTSLSLWYCFSAKCLSMYENSLKSDGVKPRENWRLISSKPQSCIATIEFKDCPEEARLISPVSRYTEQYVPYSICSW